MKSMKYISVLIAAVMIAATACEEKLDLTDPQTIGEDYALSTDENVKQVLRQCPTKYCQWHGFK